MASNCLAPGYIKLFYTSNAHEHVMTLPVKPVGTGVDFDLEQKDGGNISQLAGIDILLALMAPFFPTTTLFTGWEAYTQADCSSAPVFKNNGVPTVDAGTSVGADVPWYQATLTFKSAAGGRGRFQMMEPSVERDQHFPIAGVGAPIETLATYLVSDDSWVWARDNSALVVPVNYTTKLNDKLRKKYLLDA